MLRDKESLAKLVDAHVYSKLSATAGYCKFPLAPASRELTTPITPARQNMLCSLHLRFATVPEFFQREMLRILEGIPGQYFKWMMHRFLAKMNTSMTAV